MSKLWSEHNYYAVSVISPKVYIGNPNKNVNEWKKYFKNNSNLGEIICFPELALSAYSCEDIFFQDKLYKEIDKAIDKVLQFSSKEGSGKVLIFGLPLRHNDLLYNAALVVKNGKILGAVPKMNLPNYKEFYEDRWFSPGFKETIDINKWGHEFKLGFNQIFQIDNLKFSIEICEDMWAPQSPSLSSIANGSHLVINLSASPEIIMKKDRRRLLAKAFTEKTISGFIYVSSNWWESTKDVVFSGDKFYSENGSLIDSSKVLYDTELMTTYVDLDRIKNNRLYNKTWSKWANTLKENFNLHIIDRSQKCLKLDFNRVVNRLPFVPQGLEALSDRMTEILDIQKHGLARRIKASNTENLIIGFSGGLDSTWALLVAKESLELLGLDPKKHLKIYSLPGYATSERTKNNIKALTKSLNLSFKEISIVDSSDQELKDISHSKKNKDVVYENVQARNRTLKLFNLANKHHGLLVGTGDLSEISLGWCTYNADHMSSYNVNSSVPKTLIKFLVKTYGLVTNNKKIIKALSDICDTPISPELIQEESSNITQETENILGSYDLHDFFLYNIIKHQYNDEKIIFLAQIAFKDDFDIKEIKRVFQIFKKRFKISQFKRDCVPGGPKIGTVSLSPRGDWRMPTELDLF